MRSYHTPYVRASYLMCASHCLGGDCDEVPSCPKFRVVLQMRFRVSGPMRAPHIIQMLQVCLPNGAGLRSEWC